MFRLELRLGTLHVKLLVTASVPFLTSSNRVKLLIAALPSAREAWLTGALLRQQRVYFKRVSSRAQLGITELAASYEAFPLYGDVSNTRGLRLVHRVTTSMVKVFIDKRLSQYTIETNSIDRCVSKATALQFVLAEMLVVR